jgi:tetratricopeptide (TPR) repeat protein
MEALAQQSYADDDSAVLVDRPPAAGWDANDYPATAFEGAQAYGASLDDAVDQQLDDEALGQDIDQEVAAELGAQRGEAAETDDGEDMPFDPIAAREFDRGVSGVKVETDAVYVNAFEETALPAPSYDDVSDPMSVSGGYDPYGTESVQPSYEATVMAEPMSEEAVDTPAVGGRAESLVEDDLEEVNFYSDQGMYGEAIDSLRGLFDRYPGHPLLTAKLRELEALEAGIEPVLHTPPAGQPNHIGVGSSHEHTGTDALDLDEIEEVSADDMLEEVEPGESGPARTAAKRRPSVMLEKPVDESDADTHYDLGLAYKEMGLYDEAIKAFEKVLRAPGREVQCRVMIGMCHREMNNPTEAIHEFKQGLHANASERERLSLYYEIGITYEAMGDLGEALYYYEAVLKRDSSFADTTQRADAIRVRGTRPSQPADDDL